MKLQPRLFAANPQAMAAVSKARRTYEGHPDLGAAVDRDTWLTPRYILDQLGAFDLDPCAADAAPLWVAPAACLKAEDGLRQAWSGRVFMNPPFSDTAHWLEKHAAHGRGIRPATARRRAHRLDAGGCRGPARHVTRRRPARAVGPSLRRFP